MIPRSRSAPTAAAMSIECTTSANSTVTCLYSADRVAEVTGVPQSLQNLAVGLDGAPQEPQENAVAVSPPPPSPLGSTSVSFHRCSVTSVISPCHLRHEVFRPIARLPRRVADRVAAMGQRDALLSAGSPATTPSRWVSAYPAKTRGPRSLTPRLTRTDRPPRLDPWPRLHA